jgi:hypothetical protein
LRAERVKALSCAVEYTAPIVFWVKLIRAIPAQPEANAAANTTPLQATSGAPTTDFNWTKCPTPRRAVAASLVEPAPLRVDEICAGSISRSQRTVEALSHGLPPDPGAAVGLLGPAAGVRWNGTARSTAERRGLGARSRRARHVVARFAHAES